MLALLPRNSAGNYVEAHVRKLLCYATFVMLTILMAACANSGGGTPTPLPLPEETAEPALAATPTIPSPVEETEEPEEPGGYPGPGDDGAYPAPDDLAGYPEPPLPPTPDPYPGGVVWIIHPVGVQCEDGRLFADLAAATASLEENGISVLRAEETELLVCQSCDCPTSLHYRLQIDPADLVQAIRLGWQQE